MKRTLFQLWVFTVFLVVPSTAFHPRSVTVATRRRSAVSSPAILYAVADNQSDDDLKTGYRLGSYMLAATGAFLLLMPDRTGRTLVASKVGGAIGYGLAAGLCYILCVRKCFFNSTDSNSNNLIFFLLQRRCL